MSSKDKREEAAPGIEKSGWKASGLSTGSDLYQKHVKIMPKRVKGFFRRLKWAALIVMLGVYYLVPFIRWDRGPGAPSQAVLVDFEHSRFYFFFLEIWPQEIYYFTGLMILAAIFLFFLTALFGRVWCGYACPQTVWTDLFVAVERYFEGDRNARIRLEKAPWSASKIRKKLSKHIVWLLIAMATGGAWILYFHDAPTLLKDLFKGTAPITAYLFLGIMTFTTYALAGFMREQVCIYMCPWPRIQAAMIDEDALNVTYRADRGEPRGPHKKGATWDGRGDCIDCLQCVAVCPTGIDIRDGLQLECIGCALCIDACDGIMEKIGRPKGLIAYDTDKNSERRKKGEKSQFNLIRPRTIGYAILMSAIAGFILYGTMNRSVLDLNVQRDRSPNFVKLSDGSVRNGYTLKILNRTSDDRFLTVKAEGLLGAEISVIGLQRQDGEYKLFVPANKSHDYKVYLKITDIDGMKQRESFSFKISDSDKGDFTMTESLFVTGRE